jgi:hypothetical protein
LGRTALAAARQAESDAFPSALDADDWHILQEQLGKFVDALKLPPQSRRLQHDNAPASGPNQQDPAQP